ncbi:alanine racemase [Metabacillus sp. GX 13764]|uniref:alanine racemase n=1 Tax=Metabacillus kandeliae TaxID=2900151 RepID=UPI001E3EF2CB|nr:alanine racemase [Metabacillus kandeliae]MCD7036708.1 alanine racemase [Metabacillus kandeliae]
MIEEPFYRDTWAEINLDAIQNNVRNMKKLSGEKVKIIAVVKANAYGHGYAEVAEAALAAGAESLAVAFLDEGLYLRSAGIKAPILVLGAARAGDAALAAEHQIALTVFSEEWLKEAASHLHDKKLSIHIKLDTGMGRLGFTEKDALDRFAAYAASAEKVEIKGIYTHFATADELDTGYFEKQAARFEELLEGLPAENWLVHCANSAAGLRFPAKHFNAVRLGISMYGLSPSAEMKSELPFPLEEALSLHTRIVQVKKLKKGESVSYGATFTAEEDMWAGTLPVGYADGWIRKLKGSEVLLNGERVPIIGRICMDQCLIRLPGEVKTGEKVTLIGRQGEAFIPVDEIAERLETINYEVTCMMAARVPRMYLKNGSIMKVKNYLLS